MKCSEYLWKVVEILVTGSSGVSFDENLIPVCEDFDNYEIISDLNGEVVSKNDVLSIYHNKFSELLDAYEENNKQKFKDICEQELAAKTAWKMIK